MCIYHRFTCRSCTLTQDRLLTCQTAYLRRRYCEGIQQVAATHQALQGRPSICRCCGVVSQPPAAQLTQQTPTQSAPTPDRPQQAPTQPTPTPAPQQTDEVKRGIDLEATLKRYNEVRYRIFAQVEAEAEAAEKKKKKQERGATAAGQEQEGESVLEAAWQKLKAEIERA